MVGPDPSRNHVLEEHPGWTGCETISSQHSHTAQTHLLILKQLPHVFGVQREGVLVVWTRRNVIRIIYQKYLYENSF